MKLVACITGHGYGHAARTLLVLEEIRGVDPSVEITISTTVPRRFFGKLVRAEGGGRVSWRDRAYEPGTAQRDCFEVDIPGTCRWYRDYLQRRPRLLREETEFLRESRASGLLADIPAVSLSAAHAAGIPSAALWNFTWDWILEPILGECRAADGDLRRIPEMLHEDYRRAGLHLRLPFSPSHCDLAGVVDAPIVGRRSPVRREATRRGLGLDPADPRPVVLVAMGGWDCSHWEPIEVRGCAEFRFLVVGDLPLRFSDATTGSTARHTAGCARAPLRGATTGSTPALASAGPHVVRLPADLGEELSFSDLVAAVDIVFSKPGYGIASECAVNRTPLLGIERVGSLEAAELVRGFGSLGPLVEISREAFFHGDWAPYLTRLQQAPHRWRVVPEDGALQVARRLYEYFQGA